MPLKRFLNDGPKKFKKSFLMMELKSSKRFLIDVNKKFLIVKLKRFLNDVTEKVL